MTGHIFDERVSKEAGFAEVYRERVGAFLQNREHKGRGSLTRDGLKLTLVVLVSFGLSAVLARSGSSALALGPLILGAIVLFLFRRPARPGAGAKAPVLRVMLCNLFGDMELHETVPDGFMSIQTLRRLHVLRQSRETRADLGVSGTSRGVRYRMIKTRLTGVELLIDEDEIPKSDFNGVILEIECPTQLPRIVFGLDGGALLYYFFDTKARDTLPQFLANVDDPEFNARFELFTDDVARTRALLGQRFTQTMLHLSETCLSKGGFMAGAFEGHRVYLAIDLPHDFLGFSTARGSLLSRDDQIQDALADLSVPHQVIDALLS